jgi:hypothetical protein
MTDKTAAGTLTRRPATASERAGESSAPAAPGDTPMRVEADDPAPAWTI